MRNAWVDTRLRKFDDGFRCVVDVCGLENWHEKGSHGRSLRESFRNLGHLVKEKRGLADEACQLCLTWQIGERTYTEAVCQILEIFQCRSRHHISEGCQSLVKVYERLMHPDLNED